MDKKYTVLSFSNDELYNLLFMAWYAHVEYKVDGIEIETFNKIDEIFSAVPNSEGYEDVRDNTYQGNFKVFIKE